ncbi:hypothetical protein [Polaromonas eurypsychrophila]|uniref:Uncharacterized protein n=1 Tax=Polaromonas eurypsychrophila TaxID=1614635 RepID=A0A916SUH4_9BURK|nr:hypothetical protein [Polaromonas eurypsychrophila]GGB14327.1 hypothetical protein GCM10011496_39100 [Polaromonas eurypsychrophila]
MNAIPSATNPIVAAISALYGFVRSIDQGLDQLLEKMKQSENSTVSRTASVIEGAKYGFGIGYVTSVIILAVGQLILGNPLAAVGAVASAAVLINPIAMTCGAIGAIYYGWQALDDDAKNAILSRLMEAFSIGAELIKAIISFVLVRTKDLLSSENLTEVKRFITEAASAFGNSLSDVTKAIKDTVVDTYETVSSKAKQGAADAHDFIANKLRREKLGVSCELPMTEVADKLEPPTLR